MTIDPDNCEALIEYAVGHGITPADVERRIMTAEVRNLNT